MKLSTLNGVKIYDLSSGKSLPEYMEEANKRNIKLKSLEDYRNRIELIQDFDFPVAATRVRVSPDTGYIVASGVYPPRIKIYETSELGLKVERGIDAEVIQMQVLSDDYSKLALLCDDRNIELHAQYGRHFKIRIPKFGRDMVYNPHTAEIITVGATNEIYRLNLGMGRFQSPFISDADENTCIAYSKQLELVATGSIDSRVEFWDQNQKDKAHTLQLPQGMLGQEISAIAFEPTQALQVSIGTEKGKVLQYDMRYPVPMHTLTHHYRFPIKQIKYHSASRKLITADKKIIKIWDQQSGSLFTNIEPKAHINDIETVGDSGLLFAPCETEKLGIYFVPELGNAPKWCAFLENLTEEMEESNQTNLYDDFKFVTATDLEKLQASHLIGSSMLKGYMHGYFMELKAYQKLLLSNDPFAYEKFKKEQVEKKLNKQRERIQVTKKRVTGETDVRVNQRFVDELIAQNTSAKSRKKTTDVEALISDDRFKVMFEDEEFKRDHRLEASKRTYGDAVENKADDSDDSDIEQLREQEAPKKSALNNLFSGKQEGAGEEEADADEAYLAKLNRQERKTHKKKQRNNRDKITTKDAKVLMGGRTVAENADLSKVSERSKAIKKKGDKSAKGTSHEITKAKVLAKLAKSRVAVSTYRINR